MPSPVDGAAASADDLARARRELEVAAIYLSLDIANTDTLSALAEKVSTAACALVMGRV